MKFTRSMTMALAMMALFVVSLAVRAQDSASGLKSQIKAPTNTSQTVVPARGRRFAHRKPTGNRSAIPPVTVLNNPEYLSGEASVSIAANSNPLLRIGMAQNGVTLIEFPASDKFFAIHAGNSDLVTVEKSPSLKRDHHSKHFAKFEIDGEQWSLVSVDQQQRVKEREIDFNKRTVSAYRMRLYGVIHNPIKLYNIRDYKERAAKAKGRIKHLREEIKQLQPIRERVAEFIEERRAVLQDSVQHETQSARTLNRAVAEKVDLHFKHEDEIPQPEFSGKELDQLEENAATLRDPQMLKAAQNYLAQHYGDTREGMEKIAARAASVEESAKASWRSAGERIMSFVENREFFPVLFRVADGSEKTATLNELAPKTLGEKVVSYFSPSQRLEIAAVEQALDQHQTDLRQERDMLQQFTQGATEIAQSYRESLQTLNVVIAQPQFATQEIAGIDSFAAQETATSLGTQFQEVTVSAKSGNGIAAISNPAQQAATGIDLGMPRQQSTVDDHLEQARQRLDNVSAESVAANETGMGAGLVVDTEAAGPEALAALL